MTRTSATVSSTARTSSTLVRPTRIGRTNRRAPISWRSSDLVHPVDREAADDRTEGDEGQPAVPDPTLLHGGQPAQRDDERHRIEEVAVAVLEPAAAVVEERRDQDRDGR